MVSAFNLRDLQAGAPFGAFEVSRVLNVLAMLRLCGTAGQ